MLDMTNPTELLALTLPRQFGGDMAWQMHPSQGRAERRLALGVAVSLVIHALLLILIPRHLPVTNTAGTPGQGPLEVLLSRSAPAPGAGPPPVAAADPASAPRTQRRSVIASSSPTPTPPVPRETPAPPDPATETRSARPESFMAMVESKRARRVAAEVAIGRANAEAREHGRDPTANEAAMANINRNLQTLSRGRDGTNGVFTIVSIGPRFAEFTFRGWTASESNSWRQIIEVDAGPRGNVQRAIVRRMIALIREHYQGNFNWESHRLDRVVVLSARPDDNDGLEEFLMKEFFGRRG